VARADSQEGFDFRAVGDARQDSRTTARPRVLRSISQGQGHAALTRGATSWKSAHSDARLGSETIDVTLIAGKPAIRGRIHRSAGDDELAPSSPTWDSPSRRSGYRNRRLQLYKAEFSRGHPRAGDARHIFFNPKRTGSDPGRRLAMLAAYPHLAGQVRTMLTQKPPIASFLGPHYRIDSDALTHRSFTRSRVSHRQGFASRHLKWILHESARRFSSRSHSTCDSAVVLSVHRASLEVDIQCRAQGEILFWRSEDWLRFSLRHWCIRRAARPAVSTDVFRALPGAWASTALQC